MIEIVSTTSAANQVIYEYQKKGLIEKVKRDFYVVISLETKQPVFYECFVATDKRFSDFEYDGVAYRRIERKPDMDVIHQGNIRVTTVEQTVVDSIRDFEKVAGLEEVMRCMMLVLVLHPARN